MILVWDFLSSMTFPWLLMIFQSSMTFHDFSRKFYFSRFSRFSRPCGNPDKTILCLFYATPCRQVDSQITVQPLHAMAHTKYIPRNMHTVRIVLCFFLFHGLGTVDITHILQDYFTGTTSEATLNDMGKFITWIVIFLATNGARSSVGITLATYKVRYIFFSFPGYQWFWLTSTRSHSSKWSPKSHVTCNRSQWHWHTCNPLALAQ